MLWTSHGNTTYVMSPHRHDMHEFFVCLNDQAIQHVEGRYRSFRRGRAFLLYGGTRHQVQFTPGVPAEFIFVCFDPNHLAATGFVKLQEQLLANRDKNLFFSGDDPAYRRFNLRTIRELHRVTRSAGPLREELANALLAQLLIAFFRNVDPGAAPDTDGNAKRRKAEKLCRRLAADPTVELMLGEAAAQTGVCRSTFAALIKEITGLTWREYVLECRLKKALDRLAGTDEKLTEIAAACRFHNLGYFHRTFRKKFDCTPSRMRQQLRRNRFPVALKVY